jgi:hypothetical protein
MRTGYTGFTTSREVQTALSEPITSRVSGWHVKHSFTTPNASHDVTKSHFPCVLQECNATWSTHISKQVLCGSAYSTAPRRSFLTEPNPWLVCPQHCVTQNFVKYSPHKDHDSVFCTHQFLLRWGIYKLQYKAGATQRRYGPQIDPKNSSLDPTNNRSTFRNMAWLQYDLCLVSRVTYFQRYSKLSFNSTILKQSL